MNLQAFAGMAKTFWASCHAETARLAQERNGVALTLGRLVKLPTGVARSSPTIRGDLRDWVKQQPVHLDESPWPVLGLKEWMWSSSQLKKFYFYFNRRGHRSRAELVSQLRDSFTGESAVMTSAPTTTAVNRKYLAHLRPFQKS